MAARECPIGQALSDVIEGVRLGFRVITCPPRAGGIFAATTLVMAAQIFVPF